MGGQGIERREALRYIGMAAVAATFPGFRQWTFACSAPSPAALGTETSQSYKPLFFSPTQFRLVEHLAEMIIPADGTPGAKEAGVAEFIDFMVANRAPVSMRGPDRTAQDRLTMGSEIQERFTTGLTWLNTRAKTECGQEFLACTPQQQTDLLSELAYKNKFKPNTEAGREFFRMMREYTVVGYYTSKIGLESLDYPGLQQVWSSMPGCPHPNDPEHAHLSEPTK